MLWIWLSFILFILLLLALDLGIFHRKAHAVSVREALVWSSIWIALGLSFSGLVYLGYEHHWMGLGKSPDGIRILDMMSVSPANPLGELDGSDALVKYLTGYVIEKSLSVDNIFVIAMLFGFFAVPAIYQHRVLFWGVLGALVMRGTMIFLGAELIIRYNWIIYLFGGFLILTAIKMLFMDSAKSDPNQNPVARLARRFIPMTQNFHGQHFFVRAGSSWATEPASPGLETTADASLATAQRGSIMMTPLFLALVMVEVTDLIFAVDSIPAIFAITSDPFLVFTSNVFAILGLRTLYFALAGMIEKFHYLPMALAIVLLVVGIKMLAHGWLKHLLGDNFNFYLLGTVLLILTIGVVASMISTRRRGHQPAPTS